MRRFCQITLTTYYYWNMDWGGPKEPRIRWGPYPHAKGQFWSRKVTGPGHVRTCLAVDILKATQQGVAPVWCACRLCILEGVHVGATWRILLTHPRAAAMRAFVRLLWPP